MNRHLLYEGLTDSDRIADARQSLYDDLGVPNSIKADEQLLLSSGSDGSLSIDEAKATPACT